MPTTQAWTFAPVLPASTWSTFPMLASTRLRFHIAQASLVSPANAPRSSFPPPFLPYLKYTNFDPGSARRRCRTQRLALGRQQMIRPVILHSPCPRSAVFVSGPVPRLLLYHIIAAPFGLRIEIRLCAVRGEIKLRLLKIQSWTKIKGPKKCIDNHDGRYSVQLIEIAMDRHVR